MPIVIPARRRTRIAVPSVPPSLGSLLARLRFVAWLAHDRPTPEQRAEREIVEQAKRALREAEHEHATLVRARRRELHRAEHAHADAVREAEAGVREAARSEEAAIQAIEQRLATVTATRELARYDWLCLYEDRIDTGRGTIPVVPGLRALVAPGEVVARTTPASTFPEHIFDASGRPRRRTTVKPRRVYLVIDAAGSLLVIEARDDTRARAFADVVNLAALNADRVARARNAAGADLESELALLRQRRDARVEEAQRKLEAVTADTKAIDEAAEALAEAEADTGEIERSRERLALLEGEPAPR